MFFLKVWAQNVGVHYTQECIICGKIWYVDVAPGWGKEGEGYRSCFLQGPKHVDKVSDKERSVIFLDTES